MNGKILKEINHNFIALIPKTNSPTITSHYRHISLCSTIYKIISKILVNRMRPLLDRIISAFQSAFVPGGYIHDNILLTHEIMHKFKNLKTKTTCIAIKLDMEKAYDRIKWDFILKCLQELVFIPLGTHRLNNAFFQFHTPSLLMMNLMAFLSWQEGLDKGILFPLIYLFYICKP